MRKANCSILLAALILGGSALTATGCDNPAKDKPKAEVAAPAETQAPNAAAKTLVFGPPDSKVEFVGAKVTRSHNGSFGQFTGNVQLVDSDPTKSTVNVEIDSASITADEPKLTGHLKSADFFEVDKYPKTRFESTSITAGGDKGASHTVTGNLEMHGVKKSIRFPANIKLEGNQLRVNAEFAINRKDFGLVYPGKADDLIRDDVVIKLAIVASPKQS